MNPYHWYLRLKLKYLTYMLNGAVECATKNERRARTATGNATLAKLHRDQLSDQIRNTVHKLGKECVT